MVVGEKLKHLINKKNLPLWILISSSVHLILTCIFKEVKKKTCWFYSAIDLLAEHVFDEKFFAPQLHTHKHMPQCLHISSILQQSYILMVWIFDKVKIQFSLNQLTYHI